jgi:hypothetical protein
MSVNIVPTTEPVLKSIQDVERQAGPADQP